MLKKVLKKLIFFNSSIYSKNISENHVLKKLDQYLDWSWLEAVISPLYYKDNGRPVINIPSRKFKAGLLQYLYDSRDRDITEHTQYNIVVKWFLELGLDEEPFDFVALSKFITKWI
jgi:transposase